MRADRVLTAALALALASAPAQAQLANQGRTAPTSALAMKQSFAPVVQRAAPAVVNISSKRLVRAQTDPFWEMFGMGAPRARIQGSLGSGVIVGADGVIVTNNHVVEGGQEITVALADRREFTARVLLADPRTDIAVLKIDPPPGERLPVLRIDDSMDAQVGDLVLAIGDPFGVGQTVTNGIISALNRTADPNGDAATNYIQTDAAINPGNSGGALVDMDGDLIGVNSFILSRSGTSSGVGFAVPAAVVRRAVETAQGGGRAVVRPWLGARLQTVTGEIARSLGLARPTGALVADVWQGGPADRAGVRQGDVVLSANGQPVVEAAGLTYVVGNSRPGDAVRLVVRRGERDLNLTLRAEPPPASPPRDQVTVSGANPLNGATLVNLSPAVAEELGVDVFAGSGVLVVNPGTGFARGAGFRAGDFVRAVNGREIRTTRELQQALSARVPAWQITIERGGQRVTATYRA
ncbi:Do family serine endopeptidase [Phenylobacterium sp.]|jgi:Do/DeqQ family serine protease|uniref:Do family serine endopeptidase n=1 Tax=Phenylobacterium sp. TaxID=1871053 RepID=UPI00378486A8